MLFDKLTRNSFLYRFSALNIFGFGLLAAAFHQGWISTIIQTDTTHITWLIGLVFLLGLGISCWKAHGINRIANNSHHGVRLPVPPDVVGLRLAAEIQIVQHIATLLLLMGIAGTMIGIIMALKSTEMFSTADQSSTVLAIVMLFKGVYVKFYASLTGIVGHMWLLTNYSMLATTCRRILANMTERYVRPV
jgi:hypothetical protein